MNILSTIPQLFYDLIARVFSGFLFLFMMRISLSGNEFPFKEVELTASTTSLSWFGYLILCYYVGWFLRGISFRGYKYMIDLLSKESSDRREEPSLYTKYHMVRLKNEAVGARLVKFRAEVRMLEASWNGMLLLLLIWVALTICIVLSWGTIYTQSNSIWLFGFVIPLVLAIAFQKCMRPAFERYVGSVERHYEMLCKDKR